MNLRTTLGFVLIGGIVAVLPADAVAQSSEELVAVYTVGPACPHPGQDWRCSSNHTLPTGRGDLVWRVSPSDPDKRVVFSLALDQFGPDPIILENLSDGVVSGPVSGDGYYIGGVHGTSGGFQVRVYARR